jgi:hypothetical protein
LAANKYSFALKSFVDAGFVIAESKSHKPWEAAMKVQYLGLIIDSAEMRVLAPEGKLKAVKAGLSGLAGNRKHKIKRVSSVLVGQVSALEAAFRPAIRVGLRIVQIQVAESSGQFGWNGFFRLSDEFVKCLKDTAARLEILNGYPIRNPATAITLTSILADEDEESIEKKIPNRPVHGRPFTMVSDASIDRVAAYGLGSLPDFMHVEDLATHE